jgi:beta-phosphoglucomutase-like phosphatase (HAD superfamily)
MRELRSLDPSQAYAVLCDADGTLFPSEEPAFAASSVVTQDFADRFGLVGDFSPDHLRRTTTGKNFRTTATNLLHAAHIDPEPAELDRWVDREKSEVTAHLARTLTPQPDVLAALTALSEHHCLAAVSSSALSRLRACFTASGLDDLIVPGRRYSAEDSLPTPIGKPDPAVYQFALEQLDITAGQAVAIEDSATGVASAVAAGIPTIGLVQYVPRSERSQRVDELQQAGAAEVAESWAHIAELFSGRVVGVSG